MLSIGIFSLEDEVKKLKEKVESNDLLTKLSEACRELDTTKQMLEEERTKVSLL